MLLPRTSPFIPLLLLAVVLLLSGCKKCLRSHSEIKHHPAYTYYVMSGNVAIPFTFDAYDKEETVCDQYAN